MFSLEIPRKSLWWHARRKLVYVHCADGRLEEVWQAEFALVACLKKAYPHALCRREAGISLTSRICVGDMPEISAPALIAWVSDMLYNQKDFDPKKKRFTRDLDQLATCTCSSNVFHPLWLYSLFILDNKRIFYSWVLSSFSVVVMALEGVTKRTEHHGYSIGIYLQEQRMVTRT